MRFFKIREREERTNDPILTQYEVRKSNKEKTVFIEYIKSRLTKAGYAVESIGVEEKGKGLFKSRNIVVGNPATAKILLSAHYDTCAVTPFPNIMIPTNPVLFVVSQLFMSVFAIAFIIVIAALLAIVVGTEHLQTLIMVTALGLVFYMLFGFKNKHTANDNTSGTIAVTQILESLPKEARDKVCVIYFDNEEKGLVGSKFFYKKHAKEVKDKLLINFDCVGDGKDIVFLAKKDARDDEAYCLLQEMMKRRAQDYDVDFVAQAMKPAMFPSDQMHFRKGVGVCALRKSPFGRYAARIHTPLDTRCRKENIEYLVDGIVTFLKF